MSKKLILFIIAGLILVSSCNNRKEIITYPDAITFEKSSVKEIKLSDAVHLPLDPAIHPRWMDVFDSLLIISGKIKENSNLIHIYNLNNYKRITSFTSIGRGPDEFLEVMRFQIFPVTREIYVPDLVGQVSRLYNIDSLLSGSNNGLISEVSFHGSKFKGIIKLDSAFYLCDYGKYNLPIRGELMYVKMKVPSLIVTDSAHFPLIEKSDKLLPVPQYISVYSNNYSYNPDAGKIVLSYGKTDLLEVYDKDLNRLVRIHGPDRFFPKWELHQDGRNVRTFIKGESGSAYSVPVAVKRGFYVSYSGEIWPLDNTTTNLMRTGLYFFDYNGKPQVLYTFDRKDVWSCMIDRDEKRIFVRNPYDEFFMYRINE